MSDDTSSVSRDTSPGELVRFRLAEKFNQRFFVFGCSLIGSAALFLYYGLLFMPALGALICVNVAVACVLAASTIFGSRGIAKGRMKVLAAEHHQPTDIKSEWYNTPAFLILGLSSLALVIMICSWQISPLPMGGDRWVLVASGFLVVLAFIILVVERYFSTIPTSELPEAQAIARIMRLPLLALVIGAFVTAATAHGWAWPIYVEQIVSVFIGLVAIESILRAVAFFFSPPGDFENFWIGDSASAHLLQFDVRPDKAIASGIKERFGIDLQRSWALAYAKRSFVPIAVAIPVAGWLLTSVTILPLDQRAVYERFGKPIVVEGPGFHVGLPWPFGAIRIVENGTIHELAIVAVGDGDVAQSDQVGAEDPAPASADRLWDSSHPAETSYVIANADGAHQNFQIVNVDIRFIYRVALTDAAAREAVYRTPDPQPLIRSAAGHLLAHYFSTRTLDGVLGERRDTMAQDLRQTLQQELDHLSSGVELLAVVVEAIHPPTGAAAAYHAVQAAEILSLAHVAEERGRAAGVIGAAQQDATQQIDQASGAAAQTVATARIGSLQFSADEQAYRVSEKPFLFERYLHNLSSSLSSGKFVVMDHRLDAGSSSVLDLRNFAPKNDLPISNDASTSGDKDGNF